MAKRKTEYVVNFNADPNSVYQLVTNWLSANKFVLKEKYDTKFYQSGDGIFTTARCFEFYFQANQLIIYAYLRSPKNPFPLDNGMVGSLNTTPYINLINELINKINTLAPAGAYSYDQQGYIQMQQVNSSISDEVDKRNRNTAIGAFALSIINVIILFLGYIYWYLIIFAYVLGVQGMKAKDKLIAISSLIITTVVLVAFILIKAGILLI